MNYRIEKDSLGEVKLSADAYYGAQTERAVKNFPISNTRLQKRFVIAQAQVKKAAALANISLGKIETRKGKAVVKACDEIINGKLMDQFVVDVYQAGAGTSQNMNANEVIANRALELFGSKKGNYNIIHPNDHVNLSQSTNDTIHTAIHVSVLSGTKELLHVLKVMQKVLEKKSNEFRNHLKAGRTHLQDAVPMTLGQEFSGYAGMIKNGIQRIENAELHIKEIPLGGTAIGTGLNAGSMYKRLAIKELNTITKMHFRPAENMFEAMQNTDAVLEMEGALRSLAVSLTKISNDLRLLSSGPETGLNEITLPTVQPGSSIMPGKVNPVMAEMMNMISYQVIGNDTAISNATQAGQLELNVMMPLIAYDILNSIEILTTGVKTFTDKSIRGIKANIERMEQYAGKTPMIVTALVPYIGYTKSAEVAKRAHEENKSIRRVIMDMNLISKRKLDKILNPKNMLKG
jgi:aspartate ammonia-lyase